jgi:hypothetical protein
MTTMTINDDYKKLLFYANSLIAGVLNSKTIFNKNCQIHQIKNEFNRRVLLLKNKYSTPTNTDEIKKEESVIISSIPFSSSLITDNITLVISTKH